MLKNQQGLRPYAAENVVPGNRRDLQQVLERRQQQNGSQQHDGAGITRKPYVLEVSKM